MVACVGLAGAAVAGHAGDRPRGVVELFTSQGCNSCPPADAVLADIARRGDTVALAYHVDYWDYLGWKDTLGSAHNTERQHNYSGPLDSSVYTPQAVINGRRDIIGSHEASVKSALSTMAHSSDGLTVDVSVREAGDSLVIETGDASRGTARDAHVVLVNFVPRKVVNVKRGENRGKSIDYWNSVTDYQAVGMWHGKAARYELPKNEIARKGGGCAVLLQAYDGNGRPGAILGAAIIESPGS